MSLMSKYLALEIAHEAVPLLLYPNPGILTTAALFFATLAESINTGMRFCFFFVSPKIWCLFVSVYKEP